VLGDPTRSDLSWPLCSSEISLPSTRLPEPEPDPAAASGAAGAAGAAGTDKACIIGKLPASSESREANCVENSSSKSSPPET
jgi:hypothetical protein